MTKLQPGDKYLSVKLVGHEFVAAFKNEKNKPEQPDYKGDGIAIWVRTKNQDKTKEEHVL